MHAFNHNLRLTAATALALLLSSYLYSASADGAEVRDISKVNGGIRVSEEEQVGNISSVNGGVSLRRGASAHDVGTVNGGIELDDEVEITAAETVNGGIRVGRDVRVNGSLHTVNGGIRTRAGTVVEHDIRSVNGKIRLENTHVGDDLQTSNGDIELREGTVIEGDLIVKGRRSWFERLFSRNRRPTDIVIDSTSSVRGDIHLWREVNLRIDDDAEVGDIVYHYK